MKIKYRINDLCPSGESVCFGIKYDCPVHSGGHNMSMSIEMDKLMNLHGIIKETIFRQVRSHQCDSIREKERKDEWDRKCKETEEKLKLIDLKKIIGDYEVEVE